MSELSFGGLIRSVGAPGTVVGAEIRRGCVKTGFAGTGPLLDEGVDNEGPAGLVIAGLNIGCWSPTESCARAAFVEHKTSTMKTVKVVAMVNDGARFLVLL